MTTPQPHEHIVKSYDEEQRRLVGEILHMGEMAVAQLEAALDVVERRDDRAAQRVIGNDDTESERRAIVAALEAHAGVVARAAAELGLSRQALYRRMDRLGISLERQLRQS